MAAQAEPLGESLDGARFSPLHHRFWLLAALGIMLDGFDFFIIGVAGPLLAKDFHLPPPELGLVRAAAIVARCSAQACSGRSPTGSGGGGSSAST